MTNTKHTPGPYDQHLTCKQHGFDSEPLQNVDGTVYVTQISNATYHIGKIIQYGQRDWNEAAATAQVMLAGPEMLEALKLAKSHLPKRREWSPEEYEVQNECEIERLHDQVDAAIAKAEGKI